MTPEIGVMFRREQHPASLIDYARRVEAMGFDQLWVVEDCFFMGGVAQAAIALAATSRLTIGLGINPAVARNPAFLAMEYATLASAFPGRFIGGIGHGFGGWMAQVGAKPASWLQSIYEVVAAVRRILRGESVTAHGTYANLDRVQLFDPPPVVPPVLLGVQSEKSLRVAGRCADGLLLAEGAGPDYVRWAREQMMTGRADSGRDGAGMVVVYAYCMVDDAAPATARGHIRDAVAAMNGSGLQPSAIRLPYANAIADMAARGGADALRAEMPDAWLDDLAITGTGDEALASMARLANAGGNAVVLVPPDDVDVDAWLDGAFMHRASGLRSLGNVEPAG